MRSASRLFSTIALVVLSTKTASAEIKKGPWVQRVTPTSAVVRVEVEPAAALTLDVTGGADAGAKHLTSASQTLHTFKLDGLQSGTRYSVTAKAGSASKPGAFATAPSGADSGFHFLVYGDNRTDDAAHEAVVHAMLSHGSDFLIHTGDFVSNGANAAQWQRFFDIEAPILATGCIFSAVGNHELIDAQGIQYARYFGPTDVPGTLRPEQLDGTFRWGNARFFLLNGNPGFGDADRSWLENMLREADTEAGLVWRILVVHHGLWSSGPHGGNPRLAAVPSLLKAHKVDLVISGHDHIYERGFGDGVAYVVSGGGGAPLYPIKAVVPQSQKTASVHHFIDMTVSATALESVAIRPDGSVVDRCSLTKAAAGWTCDVRSVTSSAAPDAPPPPATSASPVVASEPRPSRCSCRVPGNGAEHDGRALFSGAVALAAFIARRRRDHRLAS